MGLTTSKSGIDPEARLLLNAAQGKRTRKGQAVLRRKDTSQVESQHHQIRYFIAIP
jgi:hypothetical protein